MSEICYLNGELSLMELKELVYRIRLPDYKVLQSHPD